MGQAIVLSHSGGSKYTVQYLVDTEMVTAENKRLAAKITELESKIIAKSNEIITLENSANAKSDEIDLLVNTTTEKGEEYLKALTELSKQLSEINNKIITAKIDLANTQLALADTKKIKNITEEELGKNRNIEVWSTDFNEGIAAGTRVTTLEVNDEYNLFNQQVLLLPQTFRAKQRDIDHKDFLIANCQTKIDDIDTRLIEINTTLADLTAAVPVLQVKITTQTNYLYQLSIADPPTSPEKLKYEQSVLTGLTAELAANIEKTNTLRLTAERLGKVKERENLHKQIQEDEKSAFQTSLADKTAVDQGLTAETGYFQPFSGSAAWTTLWNILCSNGVQKWKPVYRRGVISGFLDGNWVTVNLESDHTDNCAIAIADNDYVDINQGITVTALCQYAHCGGYVFVIGDKVILDFNQEFLLPTVIGFEENPRPAPDYAVVDKAEYHLVSYFFFNPANVEVWQFTLELLNDSTTLFNIFANPSDFEVSFDTEVGWITVVKESSTLCSAQQFATEDSYQWLYRIRFIIPTTGTATVIIFKRYSDFSHPFDSPAMPNFIYLKIRSKISGEMLLSILAELSPSKTATNILDLGSTRLAPKYQLDGDYVSLFYQTD